MHIYTLPPYIYIYIYMLVGRIDATAGAEKDVYIYMSTEEGSIYICIYIFRDEESMRQQLLGRVLSLDFIVLLNVYMYSSSVYIHTYIHICREEE